MAERQPAATEPEPTTVPTPTVAKAGERLPWPVTELEIVSARLGLLLIWGEDGEQILAPAYEFTAADDTTWSVIAVADDALDTGSNNSEE